MKGVAADLRGGLYLAYSGYILSRTSILAGRAPVPTEQDGPFVEGTPGLETVFRDVVGIAVPPTGGGSLWVLQEAPPGVENTPPGTIRHIQLEGTFPVTTFARTGSRPTAIAADGLGNVYVTEATGAVYMLNAAGRTPLGTIEGGANGIAVDAAGSEIYVSGSDSVYRLKGSSSEIVAGPKVQQADGGSPIMRPVGLAIGHEIDAQGVRARYLYIADSGNTRTGRVVRVDLQATPRVVTTVAGGGSEFIKDTTSDAKTAALNVRYLAADTTGVYITSSDQCTIFHLTTPPAFRIPAEITNPPGGSTNSTLPPDSGRTSDNKSVNPDPAVNTNTQNPSSSPQNQTQIVSGNQTQTQPQTELRVIDQSNAVTNANPVTQQIQAPGPASSITGNAPAATPASAPTPAPTPAATPAPTPTPATDAGTVTLAPDPGTSAAGVAADVAPAMPAAPAVAPVPPAPASAPPPASSQPVPTPGLVHGDSAAPSRGATRYAMVRNDDEQAVGALAMAGAAVMVAIFVCVMFVGPAASSKPKPRPKGAY